MIPPIILADVDTVSTFAEIIDKYGSGALALAIICFGFIFLLKRTTNTSDEIKELKNTIGDELKTGLKEALEANSATAKPDKEPAMSRDELRDFVMDIVREQVRALKDEKDKPVDVLSNHLKINSLVKPTIERIKTDFNADRVAAYTFHNGNHSSHGFPFYKYTCIAESYRRDKGISPVLQDQRAIPLSMIDDEAVATLNKEGWFVITNTDTDVMDFPLICGQMGKNKLKSGVGVGIYSSDNDILGFILVEFKEETELDILEGLVHRIQDRCSALTIVLDYKANEDTVLSSEIE